MTPTNSEQDQTKLRTKLDDWSVSIKKLARSFLNLEADNGIVLLESEMCDNLKNLAVLLQSFESLEGKEGDVFHSFLKNLTDIIKNIGAVAIPKDHKNPPDIFFPILALLRSTEDGARELMPIIISIDEKRKARNFETFGGLLQKLVDAIEEKRYFIIRPTE